MITFRLAHGLVRCNINAGVLARAERMYHSEMSKKSQIGDVGDVTHRKCGLRFEKKQLVEFLARKKCCIHIYMFMQDTY